ncbi:MAG: hypothetical protein H0T62_02655 [Parachlamydiaceae bacterium]|nr:hypothetical protein [Parachlamydiaceae bacterium]
MTVGALLKAMFGHQGSDHQFKQEVFENGTVERGLNKTWSILKDNETQFEGKPPSHFFAYSLGSLAIDHIFVVIQHRDEQSNVKYRILQSWLRDHYLNDYITNRGADLSSEEFIKFQEGYNSALLNAHWTNEKAVSLINIL